MRVIIRKSPILFGITLFLSSNVLADDLIHYPLLSLGTKMELDIAKTERVWGNFDKYYNELIETASTYCLDEYEILDAIEIQESLPDDSVEYRNRVAVTCYSF